MWRTVRTRSGDGELDRAFKRILASAGHRLELKHCLDLTRDLVIEAQGSDNAVLCHTEVPLSDLSFIWP